MHRFALGARGRSASSRLQADARAWIGAAALAVVGLGSSTPLAGQNQQQLLRQAALSPNGRWLVAVVDELRPMKLQVQGQPVRWQTAAQWVFRISLDEPKFESRLLHRASGEPLVERYDSAVILDNGGVLAVDEDVTEIVRWGPDGRRSARTLFKDGETAVGGLHARPDGKEVLVYREPFGAESAGSTTYRLPSDGGALARAPMFDRLMHHDWLWSDDLASVFAVEALPPNGPPIRQGDVEIPNQAYRLVRIDLESGERRPISNDVWSDGVCRSGRWLAWSYRGNAERGTFRVASATEPFAPATIESLADWLPVTSLGKGRLLCRSLEGTARYAIVDLGPGPREEGAAPPAARPLRIATAADAESGPLYSPAHERLLIDSAAFQWDVHDLDGKRVKTIRLDARAKP